MHTLRRGRETRVLASNHLTLQRKCACSQHTIAGGECGDCRKERVGAPLAGAQLLQHHSTSPAEGAAVPPVVYDVLRSPGEPLDAATRALFESQFGHDFGRVLTHAHAPRVPQSGLAASLPGDSYEQEAERVADRVMERAPGVPGVDPAARCDFSQVRLHRGLQAAESARAVNALAYTVGPNIVFDAGQYSPTTASGQHLLAHELAHVVQQKGGLDRLQRFPSCGTEGECPPRKSGELKRAQRVPVSVNVIDSPVHGLLISNFPVGSAEVKKDLEANPKWAPFWGSMVTDVNRRWRIRGFSDCHGTAGENEVLRWKRAIAINNLLPSHARRQVDKFEAAPLTECVDSNETEAGRANNRSVVIELISEQIEFEAEGITGKLQPDICFDGEKVFFKSEGITHSCPALTDSGSGATPAGRFCIRRQGEAQRAGGLVGVFQDRSKWFLLEPQFSTTRFRMDLHPGSHSAGCVTVTSPQCFDVMAAVLNSNPTLTAEGYDGYPPGNTAGEGGTEVKNPKRPVDCVGWLVVTSKGGCAP